MRICSDFIIIVAVLPMKHLTLKQNFFNKWALSPFLCLKSIKGSHAWFEADFSNIIRCSQIYKQKYRKTKNTTSFIDEVQNLNDTMM